MINALLDSPKVHDPRAAPPALGTHRCPKSGTLVDFLAGMLEGKRRVVVERHIAGCSNCRQTVETFRRALRESLGE